MIAVIEHTRGPLVDGRPYGEPGFLAELEDYHRAATEAHREHSQAPLSLPPVHTLSPAPQAATAVLDRGPLDPLSLDPLSRDPLSGP